MFRIQKPNHRKLAISPGLTIINEGVLCLNLGSDINFQFNVLTSEIKYEIYDGEWPEEVNDKTRKVIINDDVYLNYKVDCYSMFETSCHLTINKIK